MEKERVKKFASFVLLAAIMLVSMAIIAMAQPAATDEASAKAAIQAYTNKLVGLAQWAAGLALVIAVLAGGFMKMSPDVNTQQKAKQVLIGAISGFIIIEFAAVLVYLLRP